MDAVRSGRSEEPEPVDFNELVSVDPLELNDAQRGEWLVAAHRLEARLNAATVAVTGAFDANVDWSADGAKSAAAWISARCPIAHPRAHSDVHTARRLRECPKVAAAARRGQLSRDHVAALLKARQPGLEKAFEACEELLIDEVSECTVAAAHTFLRQWVIEVRARLGLNEPDGTQPDGGERSRVHLASTYQGRWDLQGNLDAETGEVIANALDHQLDAMWRHGVFRVDDGLTQPERRAIALAEVICRGARGGDEDGTARPLVAAFVQIPSGDIVDDNQDEDRCDGQRDREDDQGSGHHHRPVPGRARVSPPADEERTVVGDVDDGLDNCPVPLRIALLSRSGSTTEAALGKWICEGDVIPYAVDSDGDVLRMGRRIRLANRAQRRALMARDGGCMFADCSTPAEYCVPHHVHYWELGGPTDMDNLVLLCRFHHDLVHRRGFTIERRTDGKVIVRRPGRAAITPHLRIRSDTLRRRPTPVEVVQRERARERLRFLIEGREAEWCARHGVTATRRSA